MPFTWPIAVALVCGAVWGAAIGLDARLGWAAVVAMWLVAATALILRSTLVTAAASTAGCFVLSGLAAAAAQASALDSPLRRIARAGHWIDVREPPPRSLEGTIEDDAAPTAYGASFVLEVERAGGVATSEASLGRVSVSVTGTVAKGYLPQWTRGRRIRAPVTLRRPLPFRNPGVPDQDVALARRGISLLGSVKSGALIETLARAPPWTEAGAAFRRWIRTSVTRVIGPLDPQTAAFVLAVLIGDRAGLDDTVVDAMKAAGTYHVVAISGGNVACVTALVLFVLARVGVRPTASALVALVAVSAYGAVTTGGSSVARATIGAGVFLIARALDLRASPVTVLGTAALVVCALDPLAPFDLGFWLTFAATAGLIGAMPHAARWLRSDELPGPARSADFGREWLAQDRYRIPPLAGWMLTLGIATLAAEAAVVPIAVLNFGRIPLGGHRRQCVRGAADGRRADRRRGSVGDDGRRPCRSPAWRDTWLSQPPVCSSPPACLSHRGQRAVG